MVVIDEMNRKIIKLLATDGKITYNEIASRMRRSPSTIRDRIKRLEDNSIILGYAAIVNCEQMGMNTDAVVFANAGKNVTSQDLARLKNVPGVTEVLFVSGERTIMIRLHAQDNKTLNEILTKHIAPLGLFDIEVQIVLESVMRFPGIW
ncbi:MAG: Lrp/AsnC family transcriptional regulator [Methanomassiliicoccales archaeon]